MRPQVVCLAPNYMLHEVHDPLQLPHVYSVRQQPIKLHELHLGLLDGLSTHLEFDPPCHGQILYSITTGRG